MPGKVHDPAFVALNRRKIEALELLFPVDRCRELIKLTLTEKQPNTARLGPENLKGVTDDPEIPDYVLDILLRLPDPPPEFLEEGPEQKAQRFEQRVLASSYNIVAAWLNMLYHSRRRTGGEPVRLDSSLLPSAELLYRGERTWTESMIYSLSLTEERLRELMALYAKTMIPVFDLLIANLPNGFILVEDVLICKDADGFYVQPKIKD